MQARSVAITLLYALTSVMVCACGGSGSETSTPENPVAPSAFSLSSSAGNVMSAAYTCDGTGASPDLTWTNPPSATQSFALLMTTVAPDRTKYNWVLYNIPGASRQLRKDSFGVGTIGVGDDGPYEGYQAPCSQGAGAKTYTFTLYALSGAPSISATPASGAAVMTSISSLVLGSAALTMTYSAPGSTGSGQSSACNLIRASTRASRLGNAYVNCDTQYAYVASNGLGTHTMMNGITASNLQVPIAQNFYGANGWKIPLSPAIAATPTSVNDGPIGVAINGVPIFNPCKQGGCAAPGGGDTKALGELDICNGHAGRADDYHYHAAPICLMAGQTSNYWDSNPIGWALDGFAIFGFNNPDGSLATRDQTCGGNSLAHSNAPAGYAYHLTNASPYVLSCLRGSPSPDLAGQSAKYVPLRSPPVDPLPAVSAMSLASETSGYSTLQFTAATSFKTTSDSSNNYQTINPAGTYQILYKPLTGAALTTELVKAGNANKTACWEFQFKNSTGNTSQPTLNFCK